MRTNIYLRFVLSGFPLRLDARAARVTPSDVGDGPVLARNWCTGYHQLPRKWKIVRFVPLTATLSPVPLLKHVRLRFDLLLEVRSDHLAQKQSSKYSSS
jgi:hypothetical protein